MSLAYTQVSDVQIQRKDGFRIQTIGSAIGKLVKNDLSFFGAVVSPGVWERRWYNDVENASLYYKKGDAVWVNTEQADDFVRAHVADIQQYAMGRSDTAHRLMALSAAGDDVGVYKLLRSMAVGLDEFRNKPIYYLGNLLDPVQIRVSLSDENDRPPNDSQYWADFFDRSYNKAFYASQVLSASDAQLSATYEKHLANYHLSGIGDPDEFLASYLKADLTNVSKVQKVLNHSWYQADTEGFDHAVRFGAVTFAGGQCQWFRLWKSGLLEHGGMVKVTGGSQSCGVNATTARLYTVNLAWSYSGGTAPTYDYPTAGIGGFYSQDSQMDTGTAVVPYSPASTALGSQKRYVVDVSPVQSIGAASSRGPYQAVASTDGRFLRYPGKEVTRMNNDGFTFLYSPGIELYSYYVKGFTVTKARAY